MGNEVCKVVPCDKAQAVGHAFTMDQKTGMASFPAVLLRRVTATRSFQGSSATDSAIFCGFWERDEAEKVSTLDKTRFQLDEPLMEAVTRKTRRCLAI